MVGVGVGAIVTVLAAIGAVRSRASIRATAIGSLGNFASVAAEQFVNGYEARIRQSFVQILPLPGTVDPSKRRDPLPVTDMVEMMAYLRNDPCHCLVSPRVTAIFRFGLDTDDSEALDPTGVRLPALDPAIAAAVRAPSDSLQPLGVRFGFVLAPTAIGNQFIFFSRRVDSISRHRFLYGIAVPPAAIAEGIFGETFRTVRLVPRYLLAAIPSNDQYLEIDVAGRDGVVLYSSGHRFGDGPTNALGLPVVRGALTVTARLNPKLKDTLIPGGVPGPMPVRELVLSGLALLLFLAIGALGVHAGELARLRSDFASSVTHELRTPLTQIRLATETVLHGRSRSPEATARALTSVVGETRRLQQLIDNVLHFSRAERRMTRVRLEPMDVAAALDEVAALFRPLVADRGITVEVALADGPVARADRNAFRQILLNLLDNAARFGPDHAPIRMGAEAHGLAVHCWVEDRGPGIPLPDRQRVWQPFVRLTRDHESVSTGTGLGLAVVKELVDAQGGRCWIDGVAVGGTRVTVSFPTTEGSG